MTNAAEAMSPPSRPVAILFDLDCTLTDRPLTLGEFSRRFVADFAAGLAAGVHPSRVRELITAEDRAGYAPRMAVCQALLDGLDWRRRPAAAALVDYWQRVLPDCTRPADGLRTTLATLRADGLRLGIVTNGNAARQRRKVEVLGIGEMFEEIVVSDEVGHQKPDRAIFDAMLRRLAVDARDAWFVGDHPLNDDAGARAAGMTAVWLRDVHPWPAELAPPAYSIGRLNELLLWLAVG